MTNTHNTHNYLLNPQHPVTVNLIGCGGTGSHILMGLARLHIALKELGHQGLHVVAFDPDTVSQANLGRQLFSPAELGENKAVCLITRINRFFRLGWNAVAELYDESIFDKPTQLPTANITITCVDTVAARHGVKRVLDKSFHFAQKAEPFEKPYYWLDLGNNQKTGQVLLSTVLVDMPKKESPELIYALPTLMDLYGDLTSQEMNDNTPSCSLAEALLKQDLFVNSVLAQYGLHILWQLFREIQIQAQGVFINLKTLKTTPIPLPKVDTSSFLEFYAPRKQANSPRPTKRRVTSSPKGKKPNKKVV